MSDIARADYLLEAEAQEAVALITDADPGLTLEDAYRIQDELLVRRIATGEHLVGAKLD